MNAWNSKQSFYMTCEEGQKKEEFLEDEDDENMQGKERPNLNACVDLKNSQITLHAARKLQLSGVKVCD